MSEYILRGNNSQPVRGTSEAEEKKQGDPAAMVGAVAREMSEPIDGLAPTPVALLLLFFAVTGWGGYYLSTNSGGFHSDSYDEHLAAAAKHPVPSKPVDPMVLGRRTFNLCIQCHQENGKGIAETYPPLAGSAIVLGDSPTLARILLHGLQGDVNVAGSVYNGQMPSWRHLSDDQIAAVLTYIRASWMNHAPPVDPTLVTAIREQTTGHTQPWIWAELQEAAKTPLSVPSLDLKPSSK
jgi:mono/diheme cytochrome c family protein